MLQNVHRHSIITVISGVATLEPTEALALPSASVAPPSRSSLSCDSTHIVLPPYIYLYNDYKHYTNICKI